MERYYTPTSSFSIHPRNPFSSSPSLPPRNGWGWEKDITSFNEFHGVARTVLRGNALTPPSPFRLLETRCQGNWLLRDIRLLFRILHDGPLLEF